MEKRVGIILVNYKDYAKRFLEECRDSLRAQTYQRELIKIYIVDNESSDETGQYINSIFPEASVIARDDGNYAAANNAGIRRGKEDGCEYFVIANMDVKFDKEWLKELVRTADNHPEAGIIQSKIMLYNDPKRVNSLGNIFHYLGFGFTDGYGTYDKQDYPEVREILGYASGCSMLLRKEIIDKIGGYNEEYYMYHDDVDIGLKTRLAGYKIFLAARSVVYHKYDFERSVRMLYYMERNRYLAIFSFYKIETLIFLIPMLVILDLAMLFYSAWGGWLKTKLEIYGYFFKQETWSKISGFRKEIRGIRIIPDRIFVADFFGIVEFQEINNPVLKYVGNPLMGFYWKIIKRLIRW